MAKRRWCKHSRAHCHECDSWFGFDPFKVMDCLAILVFVIAISSLIFSLYEYWSVINAGYS